jgi:protein-disulfide isomerase
MMRRFLSTFLCLAFLSGAAAAQDTFSDTQKAAIDARIKEYIRNNPQELISSVEVHYNKQVDRKAVQEGSVATLPEGLLDYPLTPFVGPKDAKIAVVEFFDYNCGYCKQVTADLARVIEEEKGSVKFLFKELPILSDSSEVAARYALAANKQGKYLDYHMALMKHSGGITEAVLQRIAGEVGLDTAKLKADADTQDVRDALAKNLDLARELGVRGTPFFVIGKEKVPGAIGYTKMIETLRKQRGDIPATAPSVTSITDNPSEQKEILDAQSDTGKMVNDLTAQAAQMQAEAKKMLEELKKQQATEKPKK